MVVAIVAVVVVERGNVEGDQSDAQANMVMLSADSLKMADRKSVV